VDLWISGAVVLEIAGRAFVIPTLESKRRFKDGAPSVVLMRAKDEDEGVGVFHLTLDSLP